MSEEDRVSLVHGIWVRDSDNRWIFEPDIVCAADHQIGVHADMSFRDLVTSVRERLDITSKEVSVKLSYQYPEWVAMGDAELDTPQYITEDIEVGIFVRTRRAIEEVDLYVSIVKSSLVEKAVDPPRELDGIEAESEEDEGDNCINNDEWHDFAISETPLTIPPTQKNPGGDDQVVPKFHASRNPNSTISRYTIPRRLNGIEIREPVQTIRNDPPVRGMTDKAKNKRPAKDDSDTSSDSDDDIIVPLLGSSMQDTGDRSRPVARRLIFGVSGIPDTAGMDADSGSSSEGTNDVPNEYLNQWSKFDEALHEMLNDPSNPALFGKDAPPVFNDRRGTGK